jgi:hypothetical protein
MTDHLPRPHALSQTWRSRGARSLWRLTAPPEPAPRSPATASVVYSARPRLDAVSGERLGVAQPKPLRRKESLGARSLSVKGGAIGMSRSGDVTFPPTRT